MVNNWLIGAKKEEQENIAINFIYFFNCSYNMIFFRTIPIYYTYIKEVELS